MEGRERAPVGVNVSLHETSPLISVRRNVRPRNGKFIGDLGRLDFSRQDAAIERTRVWGGYRWICRSFNGRICDCMATPPCPATSRSRDVSFSGSFQRGDARYGVSANCVRAAHWLVGVLHLGSGRELCFWVYLV